MKLNKFFSLGLALALAGGIIIFAPPADATSENITGPVAAEVTQYSRVRYKRNWVAVTFYENRSPSTFNGTLTY